MIKKKERKKKVRIVNKQKFKEYETKKKEKNLWKMTLILVIDLKGDKMTFLRLRWNEKKRVIKRKEERMVRKGKLGERERERERLYIAREVTERRAYENEWLFGNLVKNID